MTALDDSLANLPFCLRKVFLVLIKGELSETTVGAMQLALTPSEVLCVSAAPEASSLVLHRDCLLSCQWSRSGFGLWQGDTMGAGRAAGRVFV